MKPTLCLGMAAVLAAIFVRPSLGQEILAPVVALDCAATIETVANLNALTIFDGAIRCADERRVEDALYLVLVGQSRANADMLVLTPTNDFEPALYDLFFNPVYQLGSQDFSPILTVVALYQFFGGPSFGSFFRDSLGVDRLLQRVRNTPVALAPGYDPGWAHRAPADAGRYELAQASDRANRELLVRSVAYFMASDVYYSAYNEITAFIGANAGAPINGTALYGILDPIEGTLFELLTAPDAPLAEHQVFAGLSGGGGPILLRAESDVRQSWLSRALSEEQLTSLLATTDFTREVLIAYGVVSPNSSGRIHLGSVFYMSGVGSPANDGYGISVLVGIAPEACAGGGAGSSPFVVARLAAMPGTERIRAYGMSNFPDVCPSPAERPVTGPT